MTQVPKLKPIKLDDISIDGNTQQREKINTDIVGEYAESMRCGHKFPAVTLFYDGAQYWLADGFHRYHASRAADMLDILAEIREGTVRDARLFSASANITHGLRLSNTDKRKSVLVLLMDSEWTQWANREIARHCHVTHHLVNTMRDELTGKPSKKTKPKKAVIDKPNGPINSANKVESDSTPPSEANNDAGSVSELPKKEAVDDKNYDPKQDEIKELAHTVSALAAENDALKDRIAVANIDTDRSPVMETITGLRSRVSELEAELDAVKSMRDSLLAENAEMKKQMARQRTQIKKLQNG